MDKSLTVATIKIIIADKDGDDIIFSCNEQGILNRAELDNWFKEQNFPQGEPFTVYLEQRGLSDGLKKFKCAIVRDRAINGRPLHDGFIQFSCEYWTSLKRKLLEIHLINSRTKVFIIGKVTAVSLIK